MLRFTRYFARCGLAIWLFFFAMTADVIVKSIVTGGFHANKPVVQIEHKCAGKSARITAVSKELSEDSVLSPPRAIAVSIQSFLGSDSRGTTDLAVSSAPPETPLRC